MRSYRLAVPMAARTKARFDRVYRSKSNPKMLHLHDRRCRIIEYGSTRHAVLVEFDSGEREITSRQAVRRG